MRYSISLQLSSQLGAFLVILFLSLRWCVWERRICFTCFRPARAGERSRLHLRSSPELDHASLLLDVVSSPASLWAPGSRHPASRFDGMQPHALLSPT